MKTGTGFFVTADGYLLTNDHVIAGGSFVSAQTSSGAVYNFESVVVRSEDPDLAMLKFTTTDVPQEMSLLDSGGSLSGRLAQAKSVDVVTVSQVSNSEFRLRSFSRTNFSASSPSKRCVGGFGASIIRSKTCAALAGSPGCLPLLS